MHVWSCGSGQRQNSMWDYDSETGLIQNHCGICMGASRVGAQVTMQECDNNSLDQQWDVDTSTKQIKVKHTFMLLVLTGRCCRIGVVYVSMPQRQRKGERVGAGSLT